MRKYIFNLLFCTVCVSVATANDDVSSRPATLTALLQREANGAEINRRMEIQKSAVGDNFAHWQAGEFLYNGQWLTAQELSAKSENLLSDYFAKRGSDRLDQAQHRALAKWCQAKTYTDQARAHWYGVLLTDNIDAEARAALGHQYFNDRWFTYEEVTAAKTDLRQLEYDLKVWTGKVAKIAAAINSNGSATKQRGLTQLSAIDDQSVIAALENSALSTNNTNVAPFVAAIAKYRSNKSAMALARLALAKPLEPCGELAIAELKSYPQEMYVLDMLKLMQMPAEYSLKEEFNSKGELVMHRMISQEAYDVIKSDLHDREFKGVSDSASSTNKTLRRSFTAGNGFAPNQANGSIFSVNGQLTFVDKSGESSVAEKDNIIEQERQSKANIEFANKHSKQESASIIYVINKLTDEDFENDPKQLWDWWAQSNGQYRSQKPTSSSYRYDEVEPTRSPYVYTNYKVNIQVQPRRTCECLVAGTLIQTSTGLKSIQEMNIGDSVLSQNIDSGELCFKTVLRTTIRPPTSTIKFKTGAEEILATAGHRWWVAGYGWVMTSNLKPDMQLHTCMGTTRILAVDEDTRGQETYNLIVADNHTYFVGEQRILSFDNAEPIATLLAVPGFQQLAAK